jgi:plastocyanin
MHARTRGRLLAGAAVVAALAPAGGVASAARRAPSTAVGVGAREFRLTAYRVSVPAGIVRFNVANYGQDVHDLVVATAGGRRLARSVEVRPGGRTTLRLRLRPGSYRLVCDLADHAALGMHATIRVR